MKRFCFGSGRCRKSRAWSPSLFTFVAVKDLIRPEILSAVTFLRGFSKMKPSVTRWRSGHFRRTSL